MKNEEQVALAEIGLPIGTQDQEPPVDILDQLFESANDDDNNEPVVSNPVSRRLSEIDKQLKNDGVAVNTKIKEEVDIR